MNNKGFTLIELIVSVVVIAVLMSTTLVAYSAVSQNSRDARRKTDLEMIRGALEQYRSRHGQYPVGNSGTDRAACTTNPSSTDPANYNLNGTVETGFTEATGGCIFGALVVEGYLSKVPLDPGRNFYSTGNFVLGDRTCNRAEFYSYRSTTGANYALGAVEESTNGGGCPAAPSAAYCAYDWGITSYCLGPLGERDS